MSVLMIILFKNYHILFSYDILIFQETLQGRNQIRIGGIFLIQDCLGIESIKFQTMSKYSGKRTNALKIDLKSTDGLYMTTVNPCNQFLVDFLISSKLKSEKQGIGKFTTYNLAIQSVRKYPLPIICEAQLAALQGFGDFFINEAAKRIQKHYHRGRLPTSEEILQDDNEHFQALQANRRKGYKRRKHQNQVDEFEDEQNSQQLQQGKKSSNQQITQSKNISSQESSKMLKKLNNYKPRAQTQAEKILKALYVLNARNKAVSKGQINQVFFNESKESVKTWQFCRNRLESSGYIIFDKEEPDLTKLTKKGYEFISEKLKDKNWPNKASSVSKQSQKTIEKEKIVKIKECENWQKLTIIINEKLSNNQEKKEAMNEVFQQLGEHNAVYDKLQTGSFLWEVDGQLLDYIVIVIQIDFTNWDEQRFMGHFYEAQLCAYDFWVMILIQQNTNDEGQINEEKMNKIKQVLLKCRAFGFRLLIISNFEEVIIHISEITTLLKQKLKNLKQNYDTMKILGSIEIFNKKTLYKKSLGKHFSRCMTLLTKMDKKAAEIMARKFGTFKNAEHRMNMYYQTLELKFKFLKHLLKDCRLENEWVQQILQFFYSDKYE